jgi:hypothetical protein
MRIILLACEGRHELAIFPRLAVLLGWNLCTCITIEDPEPIQRLVPQPPRITGRDFSWRTPPRPVFLRRGDDWMVVQRFDGDRRLLKEAPLYARQIGSELAAVGIIVDGDTKGPTHRVGQFQAAFSHWAPVTLVPGTIVGEGLRFGLWVSPDNASTGNFDDLLEAAAGAGRPGLVRRARTLVESDDSFESLIDAHRRKAVLGIVGQVDSPAGALFDSARAWPGWLAGAPHDGPFAPLCAFLEALARELAA